MTSPNHGSQPQGTWLISRATVEVTRGQCCLECLQILLFAGDDEQNYDTMFKETGEKYIVYNSPSRSYQTSRPFRIFYFYKVDVQFF